MHRFCSLVNGSLLPIIQLVLGILHWWTSSLSFRQQGTSLSRDEFDKPCLLSFSKWKKKLRMKKLCINFMAWQENKLLLIMCAQKLAYEIPTSLMIKTWFVLHYNNIFSCVTTTKDLLGFITMTIRFYIWKMALLCSR